MTTTLVVGATGNTGQHVVEQLLARNHQVRAIVRSPEKLSPAFRENPNMRVVEASVLDLTDEEMREHVQGCDAVVSCLGHVGNLKGLFGEPRKLCTDAARRLCAAIEANRPPRPVKFILMNTVLVPNPELDEKRGWPERGVLALLHVALPPHRDNEAAAEHLQEHVGKGSGHVEWCSVRPGLLTDAEVSPYEIEESPSASIFKGRPAARSNVAKFMAELIEDAALWDMWKFKMPVIVNTD